MKALWDKYEVSKIIEKFSLFINVVVLMFDVPKEVARVFVDLNQTKNKKCACTLYSVHCTI